MTPAEQLDHGLLEMGLDLLQSGEEILERPA